MKKLARTRVDKAFIGIVDSISVLVAFVLASAVCISAGLVAMESTLWEWMHNAGFVRTLHFAPLIPILVLLFWLRGHYSRRRPAADEWLDIIKTILFVATLELLFAFAFKWEFSRAWFFSTWILALFFVPVARQWIKRSLVSSGRWFDNTLVIGVGKNALDTAHMLESEPLCGYKVVAFLEPPRDWGETIEHSGFIHLNGRELPVLADDENQAEIVSELDIHHTVIALDTMNMWHASKMIFEKKWSRTSLNIAPNMRGVPMVGMELLHFFTQDLLLLQIRNNLARSMPQRIKRLFDVIVSFFLLLLLAPFMLGLAIVIRCTGGPTIFGHERVGLGGKIFNVYKLRTMVPNAQQILENILASDSRARAEWEANVKLTNDPRITRLGGFLRTTSIDELPQLWNVLKGDMSLVGPRPVMAEELERYGDKAEFYQRLRPGITGLWQISGRSDTDYETRINMDTWYARNWSLWYDMFILIKTVFVVLGRKGSQ